MMKQSPIALVIILLSLITLIAAVSITLLVVVNNSGDAPSSSVGNTQSPASVTIGTSNKNTTPSLTTVTIVPPGTTTAPTPQTTTSPTPTTIAPLPPATTTVPVTDEPESAVTTTSPITDEPDPPVTTTSPVTDEPEPPVTTTTPVTDEPEPPVTTEQEQPKPSPVMGTINGDKVGSLSIHADYEVLESEQDSSAVRVRFTVYIYSYALQLSSRSDNYMILNGEKTSGIKSPAINLPGGSPQTRTVLYETVLEIPKTDGAASLPLNVEYYWHFRGSYSGQSAEWVSVKANLTVTP